MPAMPCSSISAGKSQLLLLKSANLVLKSANLVIESETSDKTRISADKGLAESKKSIYNLPISNSVDKNDAGRLDRGHIRS